MEYAQLTRPIYNSTGLYKLLHPVILDGRTWSKLEEHQPEQGEHTERREDGKDGKHQPDDSNHDSTHTIWDSKHFILRLSCRQLKIITRALGEHDLGCPQNRRTSSEM